MTTQGLKLSYSMDESERNILLSKRVQNKRYLDKQVRMINVFKENIEDLKIILKNMYLLDDVNLEHVKLLQQSLKTEKHVEQFVKQFKEHTYKTGFIPLILHT